MNRWLERFCVIQNNQGRGKGYQPQPSASADNPVPRPFLFWISENPNLMIVLLYAERKESMAVMFLLLTGRNTKHTNLTWLPVTSELSVTGYEIWFCSIEYHGIEFGVTEFVVAG